MKIERGESTQIRESDDTHTVSVNTTITETRRTLNFTHKDAIREKENLMIKEAAKAGLSSTALVAASLQGLDQIIQGFNNTDVAQMGKGAEIVLLASFLMPLTAHFFKEAQVARREIKAIRQKNSNS